MFENIQTACVSLPVARESEQATVVHWQASEKGREYSSTAISHANLLLDATLSFQINTHLTFN